MYQNLKDEIREIIEIVKQCPESLQEKCFELLLDNYLKSNGQKQTILTVAQLKDDPPINNQIENTSSIQNQNVEQEISLKDFHVKIQRFLQTYNISLQQINNLYYKDNAELQPLYDTLNSTSMSDCQIRLALLSAFENAYHNDGDLSFNCETVRSRCQAMKCYNSPNFTSNFKASCNLWDNWPEKYDKNLLIMLSVEGKKELAKLLAELSEGV